MTPWTATHHASLSFTISRCVLNSCPLVQWWLSNHYILCHPFLLLPSVFPCIRIFSSESALCIRWLKYWSLISFRLYFHHQKHLQLSIVSTLSSSFILSGAVSSRPLLFPTSTLDTFWTGSLTFWCHIFLPLHTVHGASQQECRSGLPLPPPVGHVWSGLSTMTRLSWVALKHKAHRFIESCKPLCHIKAVIHEGVKTCQDHLVQQHFVN